MLLVNARVGASAIQGLGLFAQQFISAGTVLWRFAPGFDIEISEAFLSLLSPTARAQALHYAEYIGAKRLFLLSGDDDRFMNHSDAPNTKQREEADIYPVVYAVRDIGKGEEITCDYREVVNFGFSPKGAA